MLTVSGSNRAASSASIGSITMLRNSSTLSWSSLRFTPPSHHADRGQGERQIRLICALMPSNRSPEPVVRRSLAESNAISQACGTWDRFPASQLS